ncbi:hypothetical protein DPPLL_20320 [Desulfofustis limnaeus]|uniref:Uncharacterized protein n=1 Tax=Desulfofustis limnaeus TaxID=2740163 RepID=A0ABN6M432_9BACT|nr:hypothetical protein DPPLL_20320 [Desulfofustis limnaeus]
MKSKWTKPYMTILIRSTMEEAVLGTCKGATVGEGSGPYDINRCVVVTDVGTGELVGYCNLTVIS